jgi:hypothetical protein
MNEERPMTPKEMEDLGVPAFNGDPVGMNNMMFNMYDKMGDPKRKLSPWVRILILIFSLLIFVLPGAWLLLFSIGALVSQSTNAASALYPVIFGLLLFLVGCRVVYTNIKALIKRK